MGDCHKRQRGVGRGGGFVRPKHGRTLCNQARAVYTAYGFSLEAVTDSAILRSLMAGK